MTWDEMKYWTTGEWQVVQERLDDRDIAKISYSPARHLLFSSLDSIDLEKVRVVFLGQDPYPDPQYATGLAFSIPEESKKFPITLCYILQEYCTDLHYPYPKTGSLEAWAKEGVLLWNVIPCCDAGKSLSQDWPEWHLLTQEILENLRDRAIVFVVLGSVAKRFLKYIPDEEHILTSHPSPRGNNFKGNSKSYFPFLGSRIFTRTNALLTELGKETINWKLL